MEQGPNKDRIRMGLGRNKDLLGPCSVLISSLFGTCSVLVRSDVQIATQEATTFNRGTLTEWHPEAH